MTAQQLLGTGIRLFAVWLVLTSLAYFTSIPDALVASPEGSSATTMARLIGGVYVLVACLLWWFPMFVAHALLPRTRHTDKLSAQGQDLARVGCSLLGLWLLAKALPSLVWFVLRAFMLAAMSSSTFSALTSEAKLELAVAAFECAFALIVIFKSGRFARLIMPGEQPQSSGA
jgi:hypothetical protein